MNKISPEVLRKSLTNVVAVIVALSLVFLQWPISGLSHKASADAVEGVQERLSKTTSIDVPLSFEHAYITYADQVIAEPATKVTIPSGADLEFTAIPDSGYQIESVTAKIDGKDTKLTLNKQKKYKLTASEVAITDKIKVRAITAPTVEGEAVEVAQKAGAEAGGADAPASADGNGQVAEEPEGGQAGEEPAAERAEGDGAAVETGEAGAPVGENAPDEPEAVEGTTELDLSSLGFANDAEDEEAAAQLDALLATSAVSKKEARNLSASLLAQSVAASNPVMIDGSNATVTLGIYRSSTDRANGVNPLTSDDEIAVNDMLYGSIRFDFNTGTGPKPGRLTYTYALPSNIEVQDKAATTLYDDNFNVAGEWEIRDGVVYFEYDEAWAKKHPNGGGFFSFDFQVVEELVEVGKENAFEFPGATNTVTVRIQEGDLTGSKANSGIDKDGYVTYAVNLHAQQSFPYFEFSDRLGAGFDYVDGSFKIDGKPMSVSVQANADGSHTATAASGSIAKGDHVITYRAKVNQEAFARLGNWGYLSANNIATWKFGESQNDPKSHYSTSYVSTQKNTLSKSSNGVTVDGKATWTVTVNGSGAYKTDVSGYTFTDTVGSGHSYAGTYEVYDQSWQLVANGTVSANASSFTYTFPKDAGANTYYIRYSTVVDDTTRATDLTNEAKLTPPGGTPTTTTSRVPYYPSTSTGGGSQGGNQEGGSGTTAPKSLEVTKEVLDSSQASVTGVVNWHSTITVNSWPEVNGGAGYLEFYDDTWNNGNNQDWNNHVNYATLWHTGKPTLSAGGVALVEGVDYETLDAAGNRAGYSKPTAENYKGGQVDEGLRIRFKIDSDTMKDVIASHTPIDVYYDTMCDGTHCEYTNTASAYREVNAWGGAWVDSRVDASAKYTIEGKPGVVKTARSMYLDQDRGKWVAEWTVMVNRDITSEQNVLADLKSPTVRIVDTLPEGMTYIDGTARTTLVRRQLTGGAPSQWQTNDADCPEYKPAISQNGTTLTFEYDLSKQATNRQKNNAADTLATKLGDGTYTNSTSVTVTFLTELDPSYVNRDGEAHVLRNEATADAAGVDLGTAHAQTSYTDSVIEKEGYQDGNNPVIHYTITVNRGGEKLDPEDSHAAITLNDKLDARTTVILNSIHVSTLAGEDITSQCPVEYDASATDDEGNPTSSFKVRVPDSTPLVIEYNVSLSGKVGDQVDVTNTASLDGIATKERRSEKKFEVRQSDAGVWGTATVLTITKSDSEDILNKQLAGAEFTLYSVDMGKLGDGAYTAEGLAQASTAVYVGTTADDGSVYLGEPDGSELALATDTLYYFKETKAPEGYDIDDDAPRFVMVRGNDYDRQLSIAKSHGVTPSENVVYNATDTMTEESATGEAELFAVKTLNGAAPAAGAFSFTLSGPGIEDRAASNDAAGRVSFGAVAYDSDSITFDKADEAGNPYAEFTYTVKESVPAGARTLIGGKAVKDGMVYDAAARTVTVRVTNTGGPKLKVEYDGQATFAGVEFANERDLTSVSVEKAWDDGDDSDDIRPGEITVNLLADGKRTASKTVTAADGWKATFADLDKTGADGNDIVYTVEESPVEVNLPEGMTGGYELASITGSMADGFVITNKHTPEKVEIPVRKVWDDDGNRDGVRKAEITAKLLVDGKEVSGVKRLKLSEANNWSDKFTDLPKYADGKEIVYAVDEGTTVTPDYAKSVSGNAKDGFVITNRHTPETTSVSGLKSWQDFCDALGNRPTSITVDLLADGQPVASAQATAENGWTYEFTGLPVYREGGDGQKINYTVSEPTVVDYATTVTDDGIVNTWDFETTQLTVTKAWDDDNDADGVRPDSVTVRLFMDDLQVDSQQLNAANGWTYTWGKLPKHYKGHDAVYTVVEGRVAGYNEPVVTGDVESGFTITNTREEAPSTGLTLYKTSATTGKNLIGATFTLTDADDSAKIQTATTGWDGKVTFENLRRGHTYILQETAAPGGYVLDSTQHRLAVSDDENMTVTCTDGSLAVYPDGAAGYWTWIEDQPEGDYGSFLIRKTLVGDDGVWGSVSKHPEIDTVRQNMWVSASNIDTGDWFVFQGIGNGAKGTRKVDLYDSSSNWKGQVTVTSADSMVTKVSNVPSGTWWITEYADGMTSFDGANGAKSGTSDTWTRTTTYQVNGDTTQMVGTSADDSQLKTIEITNRYRHNGGLVLKKDFGWMHVFGSVYMGNLLGEEATQTILHNIVFTLTGKNSGEVYTITGSSFNDATTAQFASASGDSQITVSYYNRVWTITNLPYDTYTVVETSDGYRDEGQEVDTILHKFYTTGTFDVTRDSNTTNVAVGGSTGTRGDEGVSEAGSDVVVSGPDAEMTVMNAYYRPKVVEVTKSWSIPTGADYTPGDVEVQLVRSINGVDNNGTWQQGYFYPVTSADVPEHPGYVTRKTLHYDAATGTYDKATFSMLPAVTANGEQITYEVREVSADGTLVPMLNGLYTDADGNVLTGGNYYVDKDGQTAQVTWGEGWKLKKNPYPDVDGVSRWYSSEKGLEIRNTYETTEVSGAKTWNDANDQDGMRPESVVVRLMNGDDEVDRKTVTEADGWSYTFGNLPKYLNGEEVDYTVEEVSVEGYTASVSGYDIANTHETEKTSVTATKVWDDAGNRDGKRPASIHLQLVGADGAYGEPVELSESAGWSHTWTDLPLNRAGEKIDYRVVELDVPDEYEVAYTGDSEKGITVTDSYTPGVTNVSVLKEWDDGYDQDGKRPSKVSAQLYADGQAAGEPVELSEAAGWSHTWTDLPLMANGEAITYTVREAAGDWSSDYATEVTGDASAGFKIVNARTPETIGLSGAKIWDDADDQDGMRPESVTVRLLADGVEIDSAEVSEATGWKYEFKNLPKYQAGKVVTYKVTEDAVEGYFTASDGANFTNAHTPEKTSVSVVKAWNDENDYDGLRPGAVAVQLYADGEASGSAVTLDSSNDWSYTWTGLDKYAGGHEITYTVAETDGKTPAYTTSEPTWDDAEGAFVITNAHEVEKVSVHGVKTWSDNDDQDGKRPSSITVNLLANGVKVADREVVPDGAGNWTYEFTGLDKYAGGKEISYSVSEEEVDGYTATIGGNAADGFTIDNAYAPEKTSVKVTKTWDDVDNQDGIRPNTVSVRLMNGETTVGTAVLSAKNNWTHEWANLDRYAGGEPIGYTVVEDAVAGYASQTSGNVSSGFTITNTHAPEKVDVDVRKSWDDANNRDGKRAESVEVQLTATAAGAPVTLEDTVTTVTLNAENDWRHAWSDLPRKHDGAEIVYAVAELGTPAGYTNTVTSTQREASDGADAATSFTVANDHKPELAVVSGKKTWDDNGNQDGIRPASITVRLMNGANEVASQEVTAATGWTYTFTNLPKYENGHEIAYTVAEDGVAGYTAAIDGTDITNTHTPETTEVSGTKTWDDADDQDGIRPSAVTVHLLADGEVVRTAVATEEGGWTYSFANLPKYKDGAEIVYTVSEEEVAGYTAAIAGFSIVNAHTPEKTSLAGEKVWSDGNDQDGIRPDEVTVRVWNGATEVASTKATAEGNWAYEFTGLDKYENGGQLISYTVTEDRVEGYEAAVSGTTITNTHVPETIDVSGIKTWDDANDQDGKRPKSVTVRLLANGHEVRSATVTPDADGNWTYSFTDLPKYEGGEEVAYTVSEDAVEGYETSVEGTEITNAHAPETTSVEGEKTWDDNDDQDGARPDEITVRLLADGVETASTTANAAGNWSYKFENLPVYKAGSVGTEVVYTVVEDAVDGYQATYDGFDIANAHTPDKTSVSGVKTWDDANDQDGMRPESITVRLLANGTEVDSATVTADDDWKYAFTDLDKYANGTEIVYTVTEDAVPNYTTQANGYNFTNTHVPETIELSGAKTWNDNDDQDGLRPESITVHLLANGTEVTHATVTDGDGWAYRFTGLPRFANGKEIAYTVTEDEVEGYDASVSGMNITNAHVPEKTSVSGTKTWNDANDQDGKRPTSITVNLLADGAKVDSETVTAADGWAYQFADLPVYKEGKKIAYTLTEDAVAGYKAEVSGLDITNAHAPEKTSVTGAKVWDDADDQDGKRPESITVRLLANGTEVDSRTIAPDANGAWPAFTFGDLPAYANGERIEYTLAEDAVAGYETAEIDFPAGAGAVIKNKRVPETVEVSGVKTWDDNGNQDGKRPSSITVRLLADGAEVQSKAVTAADGWSYTFSNLPKYKAGAEITYTVAEDAVAGYEAAVDGYDIANAHVPEKTSVKVEKAWNDEDDYDGLRPASIQVQLYANGQPAGEAATLSQASGWAHTWTGLDKYAGGAEVAYTVAEVNAAAAAPAYTASAPTYDAGRGAFVITNTHTVEKVTVKGSKTWSDAGNQDGKRPDSITVDLLANGSKVQSKTVTAADGWSFEFSGLDKYAGGKEIAYTIAEEQVEGYTATITGTAAAGFSIDNAYTPEKTEVRVSKVWDDGDDFDGVRPGSVTVHLTNGVDTIETVELNDGNNWSCEWIGLDRYADGVEIPYTVVEDAVPNYSAELTGSITSGFTLKNTHAPTLVDVKADKAWNDADNQDGKRAGSVEVRLNAAVDGAPVVLDGVTMTATLSEANDWHHEWLNLPQMRGGKVVTYTLSEVGSIEGYDSVVRTDQVVATETANGVISFAVTNDHAPELVDIPATKVWDDADDQDGMRPDEIVVQLYAGDDPALVDGAPVTAALNAGNGWEHLFTNLPKYEGGAEVSYRVVETAVPDGYTATAGEFGNGYTVTNEHAPDMSVEINVAKAWDDSDNQDGIRPESVKVQLYANGAAVGEAVELSAANDWRASWTGLPKKSNGSVISYTVGEVDVPEGYSLGISGNMSEGFDLVNAHTPEVASAQVTKVWNDADDQDGKRPESVTVQLLANDGAYGEPVTLSAANGWRYAWADLPLKQNGEAVSYSVVESGVPDDYTAAVSGDRETGFVITNSYTPGVTNVTVSKAWDDAGNQDGIRPGSVKVRLLADGAQVDAEGVASEVELNEGNHWAYTWEGLDQMKAGKAIAYTVEEVDVPEGYRATTAGSADEGFIITNVHAPELTQVEASKTWVDDDDRDGIRPTGVTLTLHANGESVATQSVVADAQGNWAYTFENLPKYAAGAEIAYTITEDAVDGYTGSIDGFVATNAHDNEAIEVSGVKTWNDNDNQDGRRARAIAVNLLADGKVVDSKAVSEADGWKYSFTGLNKYRDGGTEIAYTVTEDAVEGYDASVDGYNLTNTLQVGTLTVSKTVQNATKSGKPFKFTVTLDDPRVQGQHGGMNFVDGIATFELADGESVEAVDLPVGVRYAVTEDDTVGYLATSQGATGVIAANANATAHYTNIYNASADVEFFAMKSLVGRTLNAEEFTFELLEDGQVIQTAKNAGDGHARFDAITYTVEDLGIHEYQIREAAGNVNGVEYDTATHDFSVNVSDNGDGTLSVDYVGYDPEAGASFTNTYTPSGKVAPTVRKTLDGVAPAAGAYEFQLADASGRVVATATNAADGTVTFPELTFKAAGTYEYVISEVVPDGAQKLGDRLVYDGVFYDRGESTVTIEAIDNFDGTLRFTTTYDNGTPKTFENETAPEVTFPLEATKAISGRDFRAGDEFTFTVEGSDGAPSPANASATIRPTSGTEAKVSFGDITFTTADLGNTYTYTVHEEGAGETVDGVTSDPFAHVVALTVVDAGDGTMGVAAEYEHDADGLVFTNTYRASGEAVLTATKTLSGRALADNEFFFELSGDNLPGTLHANAAADGSIEFAPIAFTQDDAGRDFHYTMREVQGTLGGVTYDTHEYEVTLHVADNGDGTLAIAYDYGASGAAPVFENAYRAENASAQLGAHKALVGGTLEAGAFTFELRGVSDNAAGTSLSARNDADGAVSFGAIEYSEPGTYEYRISEIVPDGATDNGDGTFTGADGIVYDGSEHTAVVTVVDDGYGKLVADVDYDGGATGVSFGNTALVRTGFTFDKHYFGNVGSFDFTLTATDENGSPRAGAAADYSDAVTIVDDGSQAFTATVRNGAFTDGVAKVVFPEIGYVADGDYHYLIAEAEDDTAEMVADKAQYLAHVTVRDGQVASTTFELIYEGVNLGATDDLSFYNNATVTLGFNSLKAQGYTSFGQRVSVYPKAKKFLNDSTDQLVDGEFAFELIDEATGSVLAVATNDEQGNIAFFDENTDPGLAYGEAGTFRYIMREVAGDEAGMMYDASSILLTVDVADTDDGLVATTTYNGPGGGEPAFYNVRRGMDVTVQKVSRYGGEGLADCTYALWMVGDDGDALIGEATSDAQGYITFKDVTLLAGQKYYFKEVEAPKGHTVDPYRTAYFSLNEAGDALVLVEKTAADGWHPATEK